MAKSMKRVVSAEENTIQQESGPSEILLEERFECPICIYWLNEPVLTKCGHRFCRKCITDWLEKDNHNCPIDNKPLSYESDIFPDNFTRREIQQIKKTCPNSSLGCKALLSPLDMDNHTRMCDFRKRSSQECPFKRCGCEFKSSEEMHVKKHVDESFQDHLSLLMENFSKTQYLTNGDVKCLEANNKLWDPPNKNQSNDNDLMRAMYERIVVLEQENRMQDMKIEKLERELPRFSDGVLLWRISGFRDKVDAMSSNPNNMFYSHESYTSPYGYKFCARMNVPQKMKDTLGLHIHLMQSDNDFHLDWPFRGRIKINMINSRTPADTQNDTIMSKPEILAFHRPTQEISPRGFGFLEYASIPEILRRGFVVNDTLFIKIHMSIV